jgi:hypothetical protein
LFFWLTHKFDEIVHLIDQGVCGEFAQMVTVYQADELADESVELVYRRVVAACNLLVRQFVWPLLRLKAAT